MYCTKCGKENNDQASACWNCGFWFQENSAPTQMDGELENVLKIACFLVPVLGLILFLIWKDTMPYKAKTAGKMALIGFIVGFVLSFVFHALLFVLTL